MVEDNDIRERMPWLFGGEKWINKPPGWGHPYECLDGHQCRSIARKLRSNKAGYREIKAQWGVSNVTIDKILQDF